MGTREGIYTDRVYPYAYVDAAHTRTHTRAETTKVAIARDTRAETKWPRRKRYVSPTAGHITGSTPVTQNRTNFSAR